MDLEEPLGGRTHNVVFFCLGTIVGKRALYTDLVTIVPLAVDVGSCLFGYVQSRRIVNIFTSITGVCTPTYSPARCLLGGRVASASY